MSRIQGQNSMGELMSCQYVAKPEGCDFTTDVGGASLTRQEFADECDINVLMERYEKAGVISHVNRFPGQFFDAADVPDYQQALHTISEAQTAFATLPARARAEFDNDPGSFVTFAADPANLPRMREWGLAPQEEAPEPPMRVEVVNTPPPAKEPS